jgi:hypothetical protein
MAERLLAMSNPPAGCGKWTKCLPVKRLKAGNGVRNVALALGLAGAKIFSCVGID